MKKTVKDYEKELNWYETTPIYIAKDGMPNPLIIFGIPYLFIYRFIKKSWIRYKIKKLRGVE